MELPADVRNAIAAGRKIEAIKLLREQRGLDLRSAKRAVEAYQREHPELMPARSHESSGLGWLLVFLPLAVLLYLAFRALQ